MKQFASFRLDTSNECLWHDEIKISIPPRPFAVLRYLVENPGRLITHDELLDALWPETYVQPQVLRTYMLDLRKVLGDDPAHPQFIQTLPKRGYCFIAAVTESSGANRPLTVSPHTENAPEPPGPLLGRSDELDRLAREAQKLSGGERRVLFVTGEAGIGKTSLVDAFCSDASLAASATIARGQCVEGFAREEYYPVMEALRQLCASADGDDACRILMKMASAWLASLGHAGDAADVSSANRERMPGDLCAALEELSALSPLIFVFEDLQWADESTLHLISALARRRAPARLMVLVTYRPQDEVNELSLKGLKQDLLLRRLGVEIALAPLARSAVQQIIMRELQQKDLPGGLSTFVYQHSEGNPLFAIAILEHLIAQRFLVRKAGVWEQRAPFEQVEAGVPDGLAQMIELEIERLSPEDQRLLEAASLVNVSFPAWAVAAALKEDPAQTEEACDALARRLYFVARAGQDELPGGGRSAFYVFTHGLYREVLYQRQPAPRRAKRHVRIAEKLGEFFAGREANVAREMAMHFEAAAQWERAVNALRLAANHARQRSAHAEAVQLVEHALRLVGNLADAERAGMESDLSADLALSQGAACGDFRA